MAYELSEEARAKLKEREEALETKNRERALWRRGENVRIVLAECAGFVIAQFRPGAINVNRRWPSGRLACTECEGWLPFDDPGWAEANTEVSLAWVTRTWIAAARLLRRDDLARPAIAFQPPHPYEKEARRLFIRLLEAEDAKAVAKDVAEDLAHVRQGLGEERRRLGQYFDSLWVHLRDQITTTQAARAVAVGIMHSSGMAQPRVEHKGSAVAVAGSSGSASPVIDTQIRIGRGQISNRPTAEQFIEEFANVIDLVAANCPTSDLVERVDQLIRWIRQDRDWRHSGFDNVTLGQMEIKLREVKDGLQQSLKGETITFDRPLDDLRSLLRVLTRENGAQRKTSSAASDAREKDATTSPASLPSPNIFRRSGEFWDITFEDKTIHLQDCSGARYIHKLLEHPREALKATDLECGEEAQVREEYSGEEILDVAGKKKIEAALSDLRERSEKAKKENDIGTQENLEEQIDALQKEVKRSHGLGRYQRRLGDPNEMARSRVGHAIQATLKRVKKDHPVLHEHFKKAILRPSGKQPCYMPDPVVLWLLR